MRNILLAVVVAALPALAAVAQPSGGQGPAKSAAPGKLLPMKRSGAGNACAAYGPDFAKVDGTDTCVRIGGTVSIGVGGSSGRR